MATLVQTLQHVLDTKDPKLPVETKRILLKEALQAQVLDYLYNHPLYRGLNFYGGTCLHIVYDLNRLSEDLDFVLHKDFSLITQNLSEVFQKVESQSGIKMTLRSSPKFPVKRAAEVINYTPHLILAYPEVFP